MQGGEGGARNILRKMIAGISFFMVSSSNLKYETYDFQPITFLDCSRTDFMYFYMKFKKKTFSVVKHFSRHFSVYNFLSF